MHLDPSKCYILKHPFVPMSQDTCDEMHQSIYTSEIYTAAHKVAIKKTCVYEVTLSYFTSGKSSQK